MTRKKRLFAGCMAAAILVVSVLAGIGTAGPNAEAASETPVFSDVAVGSWYEEAVNWCRENGIMGGTSDTAFSPEAAMSRAMLATVLYRMESSPTAEGVNSFSDVVPGSWYTDAVAWASDEGLMTGYDNGIFGINDPVTREQIATILWRYAGSPVVGGAETYTDSSEISGYARQAVDWARVNEVMGGLEENRFDPRGNASRGQVAVILYRYLGEDTSDGVPSLNPEGGETSSVVYMTTEITPEAMLAVYQAMGVDLTGENVAVKLSTGEPPASNYLRPELIADLVQYVDGTIVECNTAYGGSRAETAMHYQVAEDHGFTAIAGFQILDENGSMSLPVAGGTRLTENFVGAAFTDYDSYLILSHFKGHAMAGFGGAIKNISIGLASSEGKSWIHTGGTSKRGISGNQDAFLEAMGEAGKSVADALGDQIVYVNVMNRLSVDCDCSGRPAEPDIHDIGILASTDPVALDQACIDLVYAAEGNTSLVNRIESRNGLHTLEHAEEIGLGSRTYELVSIDG